MAHKPSCDKSPAQPRTLEKELTIRKTYNIPDTSNQNFLEGILNNTNTPIFLKTADYRYIFMNREFERRGQINFEQAEGKDDFAVFSKPTAELFRAQDEEVVRQRKVVEFEETISLHDRVYTFITAKFPLFDHEGNINAIGGICTDITDRKNAEAELQEAEEKYHSIFDYSPLGIMQFDTQGIVTVCNDKLAEILSTKVEKITGFDLFKSLHDENIKKATKLVLSGQRAYHEGEYKSITGGKSAYLRGVFSPIFSSDGSVVSAICIIDDITRRKETEEALHKAHDQLELRVAERTEELSQKTKRLVETNIALEILLKKREEDKKDLEKKITLNIEKRIRPYLEKLNLSQSESSRKAILKIMHENLDEISSSFPRDKDYLSTLTPAQIQIADLIKHGHTTKEIAHLLNLSPSTIACHRQEIRKRLSLTNKKRSLQTALTFYS